MSKIEIEVKTLLGEKENANSLKEKILEKKGQLKSKTKQLNHYFTVNDESIKNFRENLASFVKEDKLDEFNNILDKGSKFSIRTREADGKVLLVIKASIDEGTSENAVTRMEFEEPVDLTLGELDKKLLDSGLKYQAKWSREREEYALNDDVNICIDKNAGYGFLAEFESVVDGDETVEEVREMIYNLMNEFGVEELPQDRLERMFDFYNKNWPDYYGTEKVFVIE